MMSSNLQSELLYLATTPLNLLESSQPVVIIEEFLVAADHPCAPVGEIQAQGVTASGIRAVAHARDQAGQDRLETTGGRVDEAVRVGMEAETGRASLINGL